jgi:predicted secreted protein
MLLALAVSLLPVSAATQVMTDADKGATVHLKVGDVLELRLKSNPTTGYMWYVHKDSTRLVKLTGQSQTEATEPGVGRPIFQVFEFQARDTGEGVLLLHYVRSWEPPSADEERFDLHMSIQ